MTNAECIQPPPGLAWLAGSDGWYAVAAVSGKPQGRSILVRILALGPTDECRAQAIVPKRVWRSIKKYAVRDSHDWRLWLGFENGEIMLSVGRGGRVSPLSRKNERKPAEYIC
jgi:hypothetical protein